MENNKYYTPSLEEFYDGFEYEIWSSSSFEPENWEKRTYKVYFPEDNSWSHIDILASWWEGGDTIRVKCLDKEDIESLGWEPQDNNPPSLLFQYKIKAFDSYYILSYSEGELNVGIIRATDNGPYGNSRVHIFSGNIKNKSELHKLMHQLNIYKNIKKE